ncbi:DUF3291 domain-containing protein [Jatrophihabitans fulvus]
MRAPVDHPSMAGFANAFSVVAATARHSDGFVWQLETAGRGHPVVHADDPLRVVSVSAWRDYAALHAFVYHSAHGRALLRRTAWFESVPQPSTALWWVRDAMPTADRALARLTYLRRHGPSPRAFTLLRRFDAEGRPAVDRRGRPRQ